MGWFWGISLGRWERISGDLTFCNPGKPVPPVGRGEGRQPFRGAQGTHTREGSSSLPGGHMEW